MNNQEQQHYSPKTFTFEGKEEAITFVECITVTDGVVCDVYTFDEDTTKDLGIIRIKPGSKTPLQKVLKGDKTIEGFISGRGKLHITKTDGKHELHNVDKTPKAFSVSVEIGELMQWEANQDSDLVTYEVCFPPYEEGRYANLS